MTSVTESRRPARRAPGTDRPPGGPDHGAWFLVLPALIPILVLSVGPLLYGVLLAFTDAQSGRTEPTEWIGALNFQDLLHDTLFSFTSFEGGEAPDIIHDASDDLADFAYGGYLADLTGLLPARLTSDIPERSWEAATFGDGVYGVPFLQEPRVLIANATLLKKSGVRIPTPEHPGPGRSSGR
ncbi:hypothetical protein STENM223S_07055 [Streptomyces tendae]